ncbi:putative geranylgeranyl pyrophosphate synthase [Gordonia hirsuta DSM 44140 = NBRC 16056]|uniref:Putative geranylgeranyl pyrophosphate synthase n=1 Tax=Gordonia hirsuta DSM 44140 = NBRC 16056 TaxID=1121927 RepID=L7L515_9ACTN|nr:polyprenyl synthetase family protein [Gordonia hirsuta]GAC55861.1 putative geranylgeranyl pyrophosphate synthase [Gordonia hirsuta DSM 44140 = NBRC 16056]
MLSQQQVPGAVEAALRDFFRAGRAALDQISPVVAQAGRELEDFVLDGGKRIRPLCVHAGWQCAVSAAGRPTKDTESLMVRTGAAIELIQACALVHDDILDRSDTRRGNPTVHRRFQAQHERLGWGGDAAHHGKSVAILLGDLALSWADDLVHGFRPGLDLPAPPVLPVAAAALWSRMRTEVLAGQLLDITNEVSADETADAAYRVMEFKTAAYTVARPLQIGVALAGGSPELSTALGRIGVGLGLAFQLRDDLLGVVGDPAQTGKPSGDDLVAGKRTVIVALALANSAPPAADRLRGLLGRNLSATELADARAILADSGALAAVEEQITGHLTTALDEIDDLDISAAARADLTALAHRIADRQA